jgi:predicted Fe-Mo cluster-binding NifX family protein
VLPNTGTEAARGAGTGAVQVLLQKNVGIVIAPKIGRKAFMSLESVGIKVLTGGDGKTVEEVRQSYQAGEMQELLSPNN